MVHFELARWLAGRPGARGGGGRDEAAQADLARATEETAPEDPARIELRLVQARLLRAQGREREALAALREVLEGDPPVRAVLEAAELSLVLGSLGEASDLAQQLLSYARGGIL